MRKIFAFIKKELLSETSYRFAILLEISSIFFFVLIFYFISKLFAGTAAAYLSDYGKDYFSFVIIGLAFSSYLGAGMTGFSGILRREQMMGTIESLFCTPTKTSVIIISVLAWNVLYAVIQVVVFFALGILFGMNVTGFRPLAFITIFILILISLNSLGIIGASFIMIFKRGDPVTFFASNLFDLLGGIYFPVAVLPGFLQKVSFLLPVTHGLRALRLSLFRGYSLSMLIPEILFLCIFSAVAFPSSLLLFRYAVRKAREKATLNQY